MSKKAALSLSRFAFVACLLAVAAGAGPALSATSPTNGSSADAPSFFTVVPGGNMDSLLGTTTGAESAGLFTNNASSVGAPLTGTNDPSPGIGRVIGWDVTKSVDRASQTVPVGSSATFNYTLSVAHDNGTDSFWSVSGDGRVDNPNDAPVDDVAVSVAIGDPSATCVASIDDSTIAGRGREFFTYTCTYSSAPLNTSQTAIATISWPAQGSLPAGATPVEAPFLWEDSQTQLVNGSVDVTDSLADIEGGSINSDDPGPTAFHYSYTFSNVLAGCNLYDNVASVTNDAPLASDNVQVTVCGSSPGSDLTVTKTAAPSFARNFGWSVKKSVDKTRQTVPAGNSATFNYLVDVTKGAAVDSSWAVAGMITVSNPNVWEVVADVSDLAPGGTCLLASTRVTVPGGASVVVGYSCTFADAAPGTNTATATWDRTVFSTPTGSASSAADYAFTTPSVTNDSVEVDDNGSLLGNTDHSKVFSYAKALSGTGGTCNGFDNTATIKNGAALLATSNTVTVTVCANNDLTVSKTATTSFARTDKWSISKSVAAPTSVSKAGGGSVSFDYTVDVAAADSVDSGWLVSGTIKVSNPNDWDAFTANVTDTVDNGGVCTVTNGTGVSIPASGSVTLDYRCVYASAPVAGSNTATATWNSATYLTTNGSAADSADVAFDSPTTETNKTVSVTDTFNDVTTTLGSVTYPSPGHYTYSRTVNAPPTSCASYPNTATITETNQSATASVEACGFTPGIDLTVTKTAAPSFTRTFGWSVKKSVDKTRQTVHAGDSASFNYVVDVTKGTGVDSGWVVTGSVTVSNPNGFAVAAHVSDTAPGGTCSLDSTTVTVPAHDAVAVGYSCTFADGAPGTNTATATWDRAAYSTPTGSASGAAGYAFTTPSSLANDAVEVDDNGSPLGNTDQSKVFSYPKDVLATGGTCNYFDNTATVKNGAALLATSNTVTVSVCANNDLTVSKTATPSFTRTDKWSISKTVAAPAKVTQAGGGNVSFDYTVNVAAAGSVDSGWLVTGKIKVSNPNDWDALTADVTDTVDNGGVCTVTNGTGVSVPAGNSVTLDYRCVYASAPAPAVGSNTATVSWNSATYLTSHGSATDTADVGFDSPTTETNKTVTVTDTFNNGSTTTLGSATYPTPASYTYSHAVNAPPTSCATYPNTAEITETGQTATASVEACGFTPGSDLTVTKTAAASFTRTFGWNVKKSVDKTRQTVPAGESATFNYLVDVTKGSGVDSGWVVTGTITVSNPNVRDVVADLSDSAPGGTCLLASTRVTVPGSASVVVGYSCTFADGSPGTNTATATWDRAAISSPTGSASSAAGYAFTTPNGLANDAVEVDDNGSALGNTDHSKVFSYPKDVLANGGTCNDFDNTATVKNGAALLDTSNTVTVTVCANNDLAVSTTAKTSFARTDKWSIAKTVAAPAKVTKAGGGNVSFDYSVNLAAAGSVDSGWLVTGKIKVSNPNNWDALTADVTDTVDNGGACTVTDGSGVSVPAGDSVTLDYRCVYASAPDPAVGSNTATATWNRAAYLTAHGAATDAAAVAFDSPTTETNKTVSVTDTFNNGSTTTLGTATYPTPASYSYSHTVNAPATSCASYPNTATITETGQTATASVEACGFTPGSDLTVTKTAVPSFKRTFGWSVKKSVDKTSQTVLAGESAAFNYVVDVTKGSGVDSGWMVTGTITVTNPNGFAVAAHVSDTAPGGTCSLDSTTVTVPAHDSVAVGYSCTFADGTPGTNTATATWDRAAYSTPTGSASGAAAFAFATPSLTNDSVEVDDNGNLLGNTDHSTQFPYVKSVRGTGGTCTRFDNTATVKNGAALLATSNTVTVSVCANNDLTVSKTATPSFTRTDKWSISKTVAAPAKVTQAGGGNVAFNYTVNVTAAGSVDSGWLVTGTIKVSNPNDWDALTANVTDTVNNGGVCTVSNGTGVSIPAGGSVTLDYRCVYASAPAPAVGSNTATVSWNSATYLTAHGSVTDSAGLAFDSPTTETNKTVTVTDTFNNGATTTLGTATYPTPANFPYSRTVTAPPTSCATYPNTATLTETGQTATASVEACGFLPGSDLTVTKTAVPSFTRTFGWSVKKSVDKTSQTVLAGNSAAFNYVVDVTKGTGVDSGWVVTGTITVSNPNGFAVAAHVSDTAPGGTCLLDSTSVTVPANGSVPVGYSCTFASGAPGTNTATVTWDSAAYSTPGGSASAAGGYTFTTPSSLVNNSVEVDDNGSLLGNTDQSKVFPYVKSVLSTGGTCNRFDNTATIKNGAALLATSNTVTVTVCANNDLTVSKTVTTSFARADKWSITKTVAAPTSVTVPNSGSASFRYTVNVAAAGSVDSGWLVTGTIKVSNPNDWDALTANVTDTVNNGGVCTVTNGTGVSIPAGGSVTLDYRCVYASAPAPAVGSNTATVTWNSATYLTAHGSATDTAGLTFGNPTTETNKTVNVTDTFNGVTGPLGSVTYPNPATYTYSRTVNAPASNCATYYNTATITETGQIATASVDICGSTPCPQTGARTIGFWHNKNGQAIIAGANQTQLLSFLKSYAPFSDASAPLTTYATNVIGAASAAGSTMNPMLKAQMLATALNVFFSDPALGGNKLLAPAPIGGVRISLTNVRPIGNTSLAFGGATSMTISQTLAYAAGKSNAGGSVWYGQVKTTQELAKDVFDAINNEWAIPV